MGPRCRGAGCTGTPVSRSVPCTPVLVLFCCRAQQEGQVRVAGVEVDGHSAYGTQHRTQVLREERCRTTAGVFGQEAAS